MADDNDDFELVRGSGNVFADFGAPDASIRQFRAILAAEIVKALDAERLTVRDAEARTGIAAADFSRIRQVKLDRFNEVAELMATDYTDELMEEMGQLQEVLDHADAWDMDASSGSTAASE